jgi:hypothetical protein
MLFAHQKRILRLDSAGGKRLPPLGQNRHPQVPTLFPLALHHNRSSDLRRLTHKGEPLCAMRSCCDCIKPVSRLPS